MLFRSGSLRAQNPKPPPLATNGLQPFLSGCVEKAAPSSWSSSGRWIERPSKARPSSIFYDVPFAIHAPAGTPAPIIKKLNADFAYALNSPDVKALLATDGSEVVASSPEYFGKVIRAEFARWAPVVKAAGAKID